MEKIEDNFKGGNMKNKEFDSKMSKLVTEKKLLMLSYRKSKDENTKKEIKRRIIHLKGEMYKLKRELETEEEIEELVLEDNK